MYVDGSKMGRCEYSLAGWGVVYYNGEIVDIKCGPVKTSAHSKEDDEDFLGADEGTNNTGELTALVMAVRLALHYGVVGDLTVVYDSTYAANAAQGFSLSSANSQLIDVARRLICLAAQKGINLLFRHVYAHTGDHLNDLADSLAKLGTAGVKL